MIPDIHIIEKEKGERYTVNGKSVYKDMDGKFICSEPMSALETRMFTYYLNVRHNI